MAIREDEIAAAAMGVNPVKYKLLAFAIGAAFAGVTGVFFVAKLQTATPEMFNFNASRCMILVMVVLGGMGSVWGVVAGAVMLQLLQSWFLPRSADGRTRSARPIGSAVAAAARPGAVDPAVLRHHPGRDDAVPPRGPDPGDRGSTPALTFDAAARARSRAAASQHSPGSRRSRARRAAPLLEVRGVTVRFGGLVALNEVDLTVPAGGVVAVIGPNGSGKSTLFNVITGLVAGDRRRSGSAARICSACSRTRCSNCGVARTFQNIRLFPNLTVLENVLIGRHARLHAGPVGAVLRTAGTRSDEEAAARNARSTSSAVRQPAAAARRPGGLGPVLRQPPPRRDRPRAGLAPEAAAARRADRRHEPGGDAGTGRADQEPAHDSG